MKSHGSLNHIFRLVWSEALNGWVAVAEQTRGRGKGASQKLVASTLALSLAFPIGLVHAAPLGGQVQSGVGTITQTGPTTTITQATPTLALNWASFNVAAPESVNFVQPSAASIAVNRIMDTQGSQILGRLTANGQVYLINPNGILFGAGAQVNVGGLVASTLDLNDASLGASTRTFSARAGDSGNGRVVNQGSITAAPGGYVALLGNQVSNTGVITAQLGTVALGAGSAATLTFAGNSLVQLHIDQSVLDTLAENGGLIRADGGQVLMSAGARDALVASMINNTGVIEAHTVDAHGGTITLLGGMSAGTVNVGGTLDASAPNGGNGGFIETSAAKVKVADSVKITTLAPSGLTGSWLIDPTDFTIAASGGDITGTALSASLATTNPTIQSTAGGTAGSGNVNVNDVVSWSSAHTLTLNAQNNININAAINASGSASLALLYGQGALASGNTSTYNVNAPVNLPAGNTFSTTLGSNGAPINYTVLTALGAPGSVTKTDLQGMNGNLAGNYVLGANIDATPTSTTTWGTTGFTPVGNATNKFSGTFDGLGHTINGLTINLPTTNYVGLIGQTTQLAAIRNVGLTGGSVVGKNNVGELVGFNVGLISNSYATGTVSGVGTVGGLVVLAPTEN